MYVSVYVCIYTPHTCTHTPTCTRTYSTTCTYSIMFREKNSIPCSPPPVYTLVADRFTPRCYKSNDTLCTTTTEHLRYDEQQIATDTHTHTPTHTDTQAQTHTHIYTHRHAYGQTHHMTEKNRD
eukprot:GHVQ01008272.1.p1 GENE.GHVQ01008272.1~~GHVQ01008272.1.p1  ORF type:complete len:124 (-),score=23.82 GHVQ01008272.1:1189-1560(-)